MVNYYFHFIMQLFGRMYQCMCLSNCVSARNLAAFVNITSVNFRPKKYLTLFHCNILIF